MGSSNANRHRINQRRIASLVARLSALSLVSLSLGCSEESPPDSHSVGGGAGSPTGMAGTGGSGAAAGAGTSGGSGGQAMQTGGAGMAAATGGAGALAGSGGALGGAPAVGGASSGTGGAGAGGGAGVGAGGIASSTGGMAAGGAAGAAPGVCAAECVDQCVEWGGTEQTGTCDGAKVCCVGATVPVNPLAHLADAAKETGLLLANRFSKQSLSFSSVANLPGDGYKTACEWYGSLGVAKLTATQSLLDALVTKFAPLKTNFVSAMTGGEAHVDRYIFGMVPLEIYLQTADASYLPLGVEVADTQQTTNQTRDAIDDMFMMTGLQVQAYRATQDMKYLNFMSSTMVDYLGAQQSNGLFFHNVVEAKVHWGRGNGWFAAGMAEIMRDLPKSSANYATIEAGYKKMMAGLLDYQGPNGLWYQVLDMPDNPSNWEESSGSAMFTYAMIAGVRRGILDAATYVPAIDAAWAGLKNKINAQGDVSDICTGTWYKASAAEYMALTRLTGDGHGQAPVLWACAELLR
jgi:rhamnogalacturonyl hydrolase YesR